MLWEVTGGGGGGEGDVRFRLFQHCEDERSNVICATSRSNFQEKRYIILEWPLQKAIEKWS